MRPLTEQQFQELAAALLTQARATAPEWTEHNASDPGITLLELLAWIAESLLYRLTAIPRHGAAAARRLALAARGLADLATPKGACGVRRVNYFAGQLLNAEDFRDEQEYVRQRLRRLNRLVHGSGVVSGPQVSVTVNRSKGQSVVIEPGLALTPCGEEIEICAPTAASLPAQRKPLLLQLLFAERLAAPVPVSAVENGEQQFSRVEETFSVMLAPVGQADAVSIARLTCSRGRWRVDRDFRPARARK
jgi:hypothetical protein